HGAERYVNCMFEDAEGQVWLGTAQGLYQLRRTFIRTLTVKQGLPHDECWSVCEAPDGAIWVETKGGAARIAGERAEIFADEPERRPGHSLLVDREAQVW